MKKKYFKNIVEVKIFGSGKIVFVLRENDADNYKSFIDELLELVNECNSSNIIYFFTEIICVGYYYDIKIKKFVKNKIILNDL